MRVKQLQMVGQWVEKNVVDSASLEQLCDELVGIKIKTLKRPPEAAPAGSSAPPPKKSKKD